MSSQQLITQESKLSESEDSKEEFTITNFNNNKKFIKILNDLRMLDWEETSETSNSTHSFKSVKVLVAQSCLTLYEPMDCSLPGFSVYGICQARILEWVAISFSRGIFPTQGLNLGLPHGRQILYHLNHQGSPTHLKHRETETQIGSSDKSSNLRLYMMSIVVFFPLPKYLSWILKNSDINYP